MIDQLSALKFQRRHASRPGEPRRARCPQCHHVGGIPCSAPLNARVKCTRCGTVCRVRNVIGDRPAKYRRPSAARRAQAAAAREIVERFGDNALNDPLKDLWPAKPEPTSNGSF
jgi:hypothetical protein